VPQNNAVHQKAQRTSSTWTPIFSTRTSSFFKAQRARRSQHNSGNGGAVEGRKFDRPSETKRKKKRREPDSGDFCTLNVAYVVMHAGCAATPRQRQTIEHFRHARRYKFGTLLEYPVEIFARNRTLIFSTTALLSGLRVRSSATASLLCLVLTSSFTCLRSPFPVSVLSISFVTSRLRDNSYSDEISPQQGLWAFARYPDSLTRHPASSAPAPIGFRNPPTLVPFSINPFRFLTSG
jgi:hypothetical protein